MINQFALVNNLIELAKNALKNVATEDHSYLNPQFIVNGFLHAGISKALDGEDDGSISVPEVTKSATDMSDEEPVQL